MGLGGDIPIDLKELRIVNSLKEAFHVFQNKGKKSPLVIGTRP